MQAERCRQARSVAMRLGAGCLRVCAIDGLHSVKKRRDRIHFANLLPTLRLWLTGHNPPDRLLPLLHRAVVYFTEKKPPRAQKTPKGTSHSLDIILPMASTVGSQRTAPQPASIIVWERGGFWFAIDGGEPTPYCSSQAVAPSAKPKQGMKAGTVHVLRSWLKEVAPCRTLMRVA